MHRFFVLSVPCQENLHIVMPCGATPVPILQHYLHGSGTRGCLVMLSRGFGLLTCLYVCRMPTSFKCQLCDKKFKGAEYLTKHMHNKHQTDIENFRIEEREKVCLMGQSQGQLCSRCPFHFLCAQVRQDGVY
jgi:hypothetical protein